MLRELAASRREVYAESDGWRRVDVYPNIVADTDALMPVNVILKIAEKMPMHIWLRDLHGRDGEVIWVDQEYVSLRYGFEGYNVWRRAELSVL
jgi:hypothetical protein